MRVSNRKVIILTLPFAAVILVYCHSFLWENIDKIGAMATAAALFAAMYQSYVAWGAAKSTSEANAQNFFQQKFNLILEQHNNSLALVTNWLKANPLDIKMSTYSAVSYIRGHENLSPYMRILYHTLKNIKTELPIISNYDGGNILVIQKKYTSLVRSFIPNDVLYAVAINASIFGEKKLPDSSQYEKYYKMLMDYDFFEHLVIKDNNSRHLKKEMKDLSLQTYNACFIFYAKKAGYWCNDKEHIEKVNDLLEDVNFFICLAYNLHDKYITLPGYIKSKVTISELAVMLFKSYQGQLSVECLVEFLSVEMDKSTNSSVKTMLENENYFCYDYRLGKSNYGFFNAESLCEFICDNLKFDNHIQEIIKFRDGFHKDVRTRIKETSSQFESEELYSLNVRDAMSEICKIIDGVAGKIIKMKQLMDYEYDIEDVFELKKNELESYIVDRMRISFSKQL
ncbi:Putative phage abortive infection protein [Kosakonia sacchari]|nr:Putative phage abortive infection protein [Kosakonia sacchari]